MTEAALHFRDYEPGDWPGVWAVLRPAFEAGDSYPCPVDMTETDAKTYWTGVGALSRKWVGVAEGPDPSSGKGGAILGTWYLRPDQGGLGDHVCNAGYVVREDARGRGLAVAMCRHTQDQARALGFRGMRFNLVVATNAPAIRAWEKSGLRIVGTVPDAFRHKTLGLVDAHVMWRAL